MPKYPVIGILKTNASEIVEFSSYADAARFVTGKSDDSSRIIDCIKGKRKSAYKYFWHRKEAV